MPKSKTVPRIAVLGVIVAVVATVGIVLAVRAQDGDSAAVEVEHVHGLGVDPADGTLYAGTHDGLIRLPESGEATLVADRVQDFMGFTVAGPGHFLASGHPGPSQDGPSSLGLIESTDGGLTWDSLSLAGKADFHALAMRHDQVYGFNSMTGDFLVSDGGVTWDARTQLPMADFAVSPASPDIIVATTEQGLARSDDGGVSFALVGNAPLMQLISWADDDTIVGIEPSGAVQVSSDGGTTWDQRGTVDAAPEALVAVSKDEIYAAAGGAILASTNGGRDFANLLQD